MKIYRAKGSGLKIICVSNYTNNESDFISTFRGVPLDKLPDPKFGLRTTPSAESFTAHPAVPVRGPILVPYDKDVKREIIVASVGIGNCWKNTKLRADFSEYLAK